MAEAAQQGPLRLGDRFLKYAIQDLIGRGGHAWVYQGRDEFLDNDVAIKVLHRAGGVTPDMLRRGRAEAKLLYRLKHPNIVEVIDAGITDEGLLYIVMELLRGRTYRELIRTRRLGVAETLELFSGVAEGVEAAHRVNAIHRDLKPENVFVLDDNTPKVLDFGVAKVVDSAGFTTEKDVVHGTMLYIAPERLHGRPASVRSDVYSLGLMLFETLSGRHPCLLKNTEPTVSELAWIQTNAIPPPLDELDPTIPKYVARVVDRAITKMPGERTASMTELRQSIRDCLTRLSEVTRTDRVAVSAFPARPPHPQNDTIRMQRPSFVEPEASGRDRPKPSRKSIAPSTAPPTTTSVHGAHAAAASRSPLGDRRSLRRLIGYAAAVAAVAGGAIAVYATRPRVAAPTSPQAAIAAPATPARLTKVVKPSSPRPPASLEAKPEGPPPSVTEAKAVSVDVPRAKPPTPAVASGGLSSAPTIPRVPAKPKAKVKEPGLDESHAPPARKSWAE